MLGNHNRCWIWGRHVVLETLRVGIWQPREVLLTPRCPAEIAAEVDGLASRLGVAIERVSDAVLAKRCRADDHQGLAASLPEFPYANLTAGLATVTPQTTWLILDGIQDSFNFGAIVRSAVELAVTGILIGRHAQSPVNSQTARSSSGAVNHLPIVREDDLPAAVTRLKTAGLRVIAASEKGAADLSTADLTGPTALIVGNEGHGVSPALWALCDQQVRIPTTGVVGSLNVAVAAGILCYERRRQTPRGS